MADGRMIKRKICDSERVNSLSDAGALFYTWLITKLDRDGRYYGDPKILKRKVFPLRDHSEEEIKQWLDQLEKLQDDVTGEPLLECYEVKGKKFLWMPGFKGEQGQSRDISREPAWYSREAESEFPDPPLSKKKKPIKAEPEKVDTSEFLDPVFAKMITHFEQEVGHLTPVGVENIKDMRDHYPEGWFEKAVDEAVRQNHRSMSYIQAILRRWDEEGIDDQPKEKAKERKTSGDKPRTYEDD